MPYRISFADEAWGRLSKLPPKIQQQISKQIDRLALNPRTHIRERLRESTSKPYMPEGLKEYFDRLQIPEELKESLSTIPVAEYRIVYTVDDDRNLVQIQYISTPEDTYKYLTGK